MYRPGGDIPANLGLLDIVAALNWVRKEISAFGGDADKVTIFGESAGGRAVGCLLGSPVCKGLFRRAICISGSAAGLQTTPQAAGESARKLGETLGISYTELSARALQGVPIEALRQACMTCGGGFGPVVAPPLFPNGISPLEGIRAGVAGEVDLMSGTNRDEANLNGARRPCPVDSRAALEQRLAQQLANSDGYEPPSDPAAQAKRIVAAISSNPRPWWSTPDDLKGMHLQIQTDLSQGLNHERTLDAHPGRSFAYRFDYEAHCTTWSDGAPLPTPMGASHALGIMFMCERIGVARFHSLLVYLVTFES